MRAGPSLLLLGLIQACSSSSFVGLPADAAKLETIVLSYVEASVRHTTVYGRDDAILAEGTLENVVLLGWARSPEDLRLHSGAATGAASTRLRRAGVTSPAPR